MMLQLVALLNSYFGLFTAPIGVAALAICI